MKELSIEQKAKAYDEAVEKANELIYVSDKDSLQRKTVEHIFPELKESESEDEKIRGAIIHFISHTPTVPKGIIGKETMLAWLEKQGEQKPTDIIPKNFEKYVEQLLSLSDGEGHGSPAKLKEVCSELLRLANLQQKPAWSEEDENKLNEILHDIECSRAVHLHSPKQTFDSRKNWLKSLKDRVQPKQEWSEEDEKVIRCLEYTVKHFYEDEDTIKWCIDWLKSLRPQNRWKPSEGQLECLGYAIDKAEKDYSPLTNNRVYLTLKTLKEQLEKLIS